MPRVGRIVIPGAPHHVTQRGNNGQEVFRSDVDRATYVRILAIQAQRFAFRVEGFCLMTNHVHIIGTPETKESLARAVGRANFIYTQYFNEVYDSSGHLWQNRFYSCALDEEHFIAALRYAELNPVRAGVVRTPWKFHWSSAAMHCGKGPGAEMLDLAGWKKGFSGPEWREFLSAGGSGDDDDLLRRSTHTGRPLGSDAFIRAAERTLGRRLTALPRGRPRKNKPKE